MAPILAEQLELRINSHCASSFFLCCKQVMKFDYKLAIKAITVICSTTPETPVAYSDSIIGFRGTASISDVITDIKFLKTDFEGGRVHRGFVDVYTTSYLKYCDAFDIHSPTVIAGHSMGGVIAALHAFRIEERHVDSVYLFGTPKFCDETFQKKYNDKLKHKTFCIVNDNDVIPKLPPLASYYNVGKYVNCTFNKYNHELKKYGEELGNRYS